MEVLLDPSLELLGAVELLGAGPGPLKGRDLRYARALEKALAPLKEHPAVALNARADGRDPDLFLRKDLLLLRGAPPELAVDEGLSWSRGLADRSGDWEPWLDALRDFSRKSRFTEVLTRAGEALAPDLEALREHVEAARYAERLSDYARLPFHGRYRLLVSPLCPRGRGLNRVRVRDDGRAEIASVVRPSDFRHGGGFTPAGLSAQAWHELSHGLLDMTVDLYGWDHRETPLSLGPGLDHNCRNWLHGAREHAVRAVMLRLIALHEGDAAARRQLGDEEFSERPYLAAMAERLREYEASPKEFPTLADFYPRLLEAFPAPGPVTPTRAGGPDDEEQRLRSAAGPFYSQDQRRRALAFVERLLSRRADPRLEKRRDALRALDALARAR